MAKEKVHQDADIANIYQLDGRVPLAKAIPFGLQHVFAMFVSNIAPIFIICSACGLDSNTTARLIQAAMLIAGIGSLIQLYPIAHTIGARLPVVMGVSFTFVAVMISVGKTYGYAGLLGSILIGGIIEGTLGLFARYWAKWIKPIVSACVVTAIGFSLLTVGAQSFAGGTAVAGTAAFGSATNWILGSVTLLSCIIFNAVAKSYWKQLSVLFGLVVGYILAICMGVVDFSSVAGAKPFAIPIPFIVKPQFPIGGIISLTVMFLVSATETLGDTSAVCQGGLDRNPTEKELSGSICCDGYISALSACFGCLPITSFSQNVGLIGMTKVVNRFTIATGASVLVLAGLFPIFGKVLATLPQAVLGGCTIMMFGNIIMSGFQMIARCGFTQRNITIAALSLSIGIGFTQNSAMFNIFPKLIQSIFGANCVSTVFLSAIILNAILPKNMEVIKTAKKEAE